MQKQLLPLNGWQQNNALTELKEMAQQKAKPLIEWWNDRRTLNKGIDTFLVSYDFFSLEIAKKSVSLMDKGYDIFKVIRDMQETIVKPVKQRNEFLETENKRLLEEKNYLASLLSEYTLGEENTQ
ncbi:MAG: hypothetical protein WC325_10255 [Candidatus Bathyarchaeia archaeon]|jgi:hypothetical protein